MRKVFFILFFIFVFCKISSAQNQNCDCPYPILFVHGINSDHTTWNTTIGQLSTLYGPSQVLAFNLNADPNSTNKENDVQWVTNEFSVVNRCIYAINFNTQNGTSSQSASNESAIVKQGFALKKAIDRITFVTQKSKVIIVGHSMGGLASREYLQRLADPNNPKVAKLLTLGTPHLGANIAQNTLGIQVDPISEASRDLAETTTIELSPGQFATVPGYYLFGGNEATPQINLSSPNLLFLNQDVNCNNTEDIVTGINNGTEDNSAIPLPSSVKYTYFIGNILQTCYPSTNGFGCLGDGAVDDMQMWLYNGGNGSTYDFVNGVSIPEPNDGTNHRLSDRITSTNPTSHIAEPSAFTQIIRGIDEGDFPFFASDILPNKRYCGITQQRADFVAANSNVSFSGSTTDNPNIDCDWYKLKVLPGDNTNYKLTFQKNIEKHILLDFFKDKDIQPGNYDNPISLQGLVSKESLPFKPVQVTMEIGVLPAGDYYFRVTSKREAFDNLVTYNFIFHDTNIIPPSIVSNHRPSFQKVIDIGLLKLKQDLENPPVYNSTDKSWDVAFKAYNGYNVDAIIKESSYPSCAEGQLVSILDHYPPSMFNSVDKLLEHFNYTDNYNQEFTLRCKFSENTGMHVSFPNFNFLNGLYVTLRPFVTDMISTILENVGIPEGIRLKMIDKITIHIFEGISLNEANELRSIKNPIKLSKRLAALISDKILDEQVIQIIMSFSGNGSLFDVEPTTLLDQISDYVDLAKAGRDYVDLALAITLKGTDIVTGIFDLYSNQNLNFCLPMTFEDNLPYQVQSNLPSNGTLITNTNSIDLSWSYFDIDNDPIIYDVFIKKPSDQNFNMVLSASTNTVFQYTPAEDGLYQWKVKAKYPWVGLNFTESEVQTFIKCTNTTPIIINSSALTSISTSNIDNYDLVFGFIGDFDPNRQYTADFTYFNSISSLTTITKMVFPNESNPQNIVHTLPKDKDLSITVKEGCNENHFVFKPYPKFKQFSNLNNCATSLVVVDTGTYGNYKVIIDDQEFIIGTIGESVLLGENIKGNKNFVVKVVPLSNTLDTIFLAYTFTCVSGVYDCPTIDVSSINQSCVDNILTFEIEDGYEYSSSFRLGNLNSQFLGIDSTFIFISSGYGSKKLGLVFLDRLFPKCKTVLVVEDLCPEIDGIHLGQDGIRNLLKKAVDCGWIKLATANKMAGNSELPSALTPPLNDIYQYNKFEESRVGKLLEIYGVLYKNENFNELKNIFDPYINSNSLISINDSTQILNELMEYEIEIEDVEDLIFRWNNTRRAYANSIFIPNNQYFNIIINENLLYHDSIMTSVQAYAMSKGYNSVDSLLSVSVKFVEAYSLEDDPEINPVCASVGISLSQKLTMTREAFEGTLKIFNGSFDGEMDSIKLELIITNESGVISNDLFEIDTTELITLTQVDGTGQLAADKEGTAKFLFIPEPAAAPTVPKFYSFGGNLSYIDPFSNTRVTMPLVPVALQVNPSPDLFLHYFMERDILGDDAFTSEVEPSIPARLAVMIENDGYGDAQNLKIQSAQPQVIDNEKGLALSMNLIGSKLQGNSINWGLNNIDFGNIPSHGTRVGEWLFTSNYLGHFTSYGTNVRHVSSRGNPDLSLVSGAQLHELIHSIKLYGTQDDGILDFLVNDAQDAKDHPDIIYNSKGNITNNVKEATSGQFLNAITHPTYTTTLQVMAQDSGWFYLKLNDPGQGEYTIVSATRNSDGQVIPLDNVWLSYVTIPDSKLQVYEDKFHLVDILPNNNATTYTIVWSPKDPSPPMIDTITNVPQTIIDVPHTLLTIKLSEPIVDSTFTFSDLTLTRQGGSNLIDTSVVITKLDSITYTVNLGSKTNLSGYYVFTAQAAGIVDLSGVPGAIGKQVSWIQNLSGPVVISFEGIVNGDSYSSVDTLLITFNMPIDSASLSPLSFRISKNNIIQNDTLEWILVDEFLKKYKLINLNNSTSESNNYKIIVHLDEVSSTTGLVGMDSQSLSFIIDNIGPSIASMNLINEAALDEQHKTGAIVIFSEPIPSLDTSAFALIGSTIIHDSFVVVTQLSPTSYELIWNEKSYPEGMYSLWLNASMLQDLIGNLGAGADTLDWLVDRSSELAISNIGMSPDLGFSSSDRISSIRNFTLTFSLNETANSVKVSMLDNGQSSLLYSIAQGNIGLNNALINLPIVGNLFLKIEAKDVYGNLVDTTFGIFVDEVDLTGQWQGIHDEVILNHPDTLYFEFNDPVLDIGAISNSEFFLFRNNQTISDNTLTLQRVSDTLYRVIGLNGIPLRYGKYKLQLSLNNFSKYLTGRYGANIEEFRWEIFDPNLAPIANAGPDQIIKDLGLVQLNGSATFDPNGNDIYYEWISLDNIQLSNDTVDSPTFTINESHVGKMLSFLLIARDSSKSSSDLVRIFVELDDILVKTKVILQGPYDAQTDMMNDKLRALNHLPLTTPYIDISKYAFGNDGKSIKMSVLQETGVNAIVDWVYVELYNETTENRVKGGSYLVQRDGDIVDTNGHSTVYFNNLPLGNYRLRIYHRNHLPIMTSQSVFLNQGEIKSVDLTQDVNKIFGAINAVKFIDGKYSLIAGDANTNGQIQQTDINLTLPKIGQAGYKSEDADMNGEIQNTDIQLYILPNLGRGKQF